MRFLRTNTAVIITVGPFYDKTDGVTIETALTITNERITLTADTDDGAAPTNILDNVTGATSGTSNDLNYITGNDAGMMQLELSAANVNRLGRMFLSITDAANHVPVFHEFMVVPALVYDTYFASTGGATFPAATLASTTNITAGTITTTTNLTNLPAITANWLTAAGIASGALNGKGDWNIGKTGYALSSAGIQAIWDALTSALTTVGSIGKLIVDNLNATVSSRLASASYTAPLDAAGTRSAVGLASANLDTQFTTALTKLRKYFQLLVRRDSWIATDNAVELAEINANEGSGAGAYDSTVPPAVNVLQIDGLTTGIAGINSMGAIYDLQNSLPADIAAILTNTVAASNLLDDYNGTGYNKANSTIGNTTNLDTQDPTVLVDAVLYPYISLLARSDAGIATDLSVTLAQINADYGSGAGTYDNATDSVEAIRNRGDAAWVTGTSLDAAGVRSAVGLASANLDTQLTAIDDFLDTEIAAIKAKTDNLPTDPADQSAVEAAITAATSPLATAASIAALNNISAAQVNAEVVDALVTDTYAQPGQESPAATTSLALMIRYLYKAFRNRKTQTATTLSLYADDATTVDQKSTVSDNGTTYDQGEIGTGP